MKFGNRPVLAGLAVALASFGLAAAFPHDDLGKGKFVKLVERDIVETLDGKPARLTMTEITYKPGEATKPHRHPGPIFGYVIEGRYEFGVDEQSAKVLKAGETFYEPTGILHRVSRNPGEKGDTRVLAVYVYPRDAEELNVLEPGVNP